MNRFFVDGKSFLMQAMRAAVIAMVRSENDNRVFGEVRTPLQRPKQVTDLEVHLSLQPVIVI
jgi:hypothetical protein